MQPTLEELTNRVFEILRDDVLVPGDGFTPDCDLVAAGVDSLAVTRLLLRIEDETGITVDERRLVPGDLSSAKAFAACVLEGRR